MRVLVLGGTRFVGLHTVGRLIERGCEVTVFHRGTTEPVELPEVCHIHGDRADFPSYRTRLARMAIDVVVDMFPMTERDARHVVRAVSGNAGRVVVISSQDVYQAYAVFRRRAVQPTLPIPIGESAPLRTELYPYRDDFPPEHPFHTYDKIPVERVYLDQPGLPGTVLRLPVVYGPHDPQHRLFPYLRRMVDRRSVILLSEPVARWRLTRGYVENVAEAIALAGTDERAAGRVYNVGEVGARTELEWVMAIAKGADWDGEVRILAEESMPEHLRQHDNFEQSLAADTSRIRIELGYTDRVDRDEAMARAAAWEAANLPEKLPGQVFDYSAEDAALT